MKILHNLSRFRLLGAAEKRVFLAAMAWLPLFWLAVRMVGLARFKAWLERPMKPTAATLSHAHVQAFGALVHMAAHHTLGQRSCLPRSLLLAWMLRRKNVETEIQIGVRLVDGALLAHAWVEHRGHPVHERADVQSEFAPFGERVPLNAFDP